MKPLKIEATKFTPKVHLHPEENIFLISGFSLPENVTEFYEPVISWLNQFAEQVKPKEEALNFSFKLIYYNSGSFKMLINILQIIASLQKRGVKVDAFWFYDEDDYQLKDIGEELSDLVGLPFIFKTYD
jgi:hypothetical protein